MQGLTAAAVLIELARVVAELRNVSTLEKGRNFAAQIIDVVLPSECWIAARNACQDHVGTIPKRDLAVLQLEHHGDDRRRLDDLFEARRKWFAVKEKAILPGP